MPHAAPAIGTGPRRPAIGAESSTSTLNCSGAAASGRNAGLAFERSHKNLGLKGGVDTQRR
eukprot:2554576-Prymnesium_polylepis.1